MGNGSAPTKMVVTMRKPVGPLFVGSFRSEHQLGTIIGSAEKHLLDIVHNLAFRGGQGVPAFSEDLRELRRM